MARIRNIKPEFFLNDEMGELDPLTRLFFIGLWTQADREGRLRDRPKRLKATLVPYDECDVEALLTTLTDSGHLLRYEVDSEHYIQVVNFTRHQSPNMKESPSTIPAPCKHGASTTGKERKGKESKGEECAADQDKPEGQERTGGFTLPDCMEQPLRISAPEPYEGTCAGYIGEAIVAHFGMVGPSDMNKLVQAITDGCLHGCRGDNAVACAVHLVAKMDKAAPTVRQSNLLLHCWRNDRFEVSK